MKRTIITLSIMLAILAYGQATYKNNGEVRLSPRLLNYQGYLTDTLGNPITNPSVSVNFGIWSLSGGGAQIWYETQNVNVAKGIFSVLLGSVTPIPDSVFTKGADRWLELTYAGITLSPRTRITAAGYALSSTYADTAFSVVNNAITTPKILDTAVTMAKLARTGASTNQVIKWNGSMWQPATDVASSDTDWIFSGNNIYSGVSGNVGIGTTSPGALFTVSSTGSNYGNGIRMVNGANYWESVHDMLGGLTFGYNGLDKFVINRSGNSYFTSGNLGLGTTAPSERLDINGGVLFRRIDGDLTGNWVIYNNSLSSSGDYGLTFGKSIPADYLVLGNSSNNSYFPTGNVGIGTATPAVKFDVAGYVRSTGSDDVGGGLSVFNSSKTGAIVNNWMIYNMTGVYGNALKFWRYYQNGSNPGPAFTLYDNGNAEVVGVTVTSGLVTTGITMATGAANGYVLTSNASGVASWQAPTVPTHNHLGQLWTGTNTGMGLGVDLNVNYSSSVYGKYVKVTNAATSGWTFGGYFNVTAAGTGICGVCCVDSAPAGSATNIYGTYIDCHQAGSGSSYGGRFYALSTGTGDVYGLDCEAAGSGTSYRYGVFSRAVAPAGSSNSAYGVYAATIHNGTGESYGGRFTVDNYGTGTRRAVYGVAKAPTGSSNPALSINGDCDHAGTGPAYGAYFAATGAGSGTKYGVYAEASGSGTLWAGYFSGNVEITGSHGFANGFFVIDHPLDPKNMILRHNTVESPENLCLYRGKVKLNLSGEGKVEMPSYFKALTKETEATVTLTSIGRPFNAGYDWNADYTVCTIYGEPNREVSYIVMADRDDPVMKQLYKPVEEEKGNGNFTQGKLLYPKAYGYPEEMGEDYARRLELKSAHAGK